jgi:hypothetical protein
VVVPAHTRARDEAAGTERTNETVYPDSTRRVDARVARLGHCRSGLASYRLTMETTKKVHALMRSVMQDMASDPKFQALQKTNGEIEALSKKEELTDAESERLEKLRILAEEQEDALEQATGGSMNLNNAQNLNDMEAAIKSNPRLMPALNRAGLTPREYSKYMLATLMAGMVAGFQKSGLLKELPKELKEVHPDNVKFMLEHEAELTAMQKEMEKLGKGGK